MLHVFILYNRYYIKLKCPGQDNGGNSIIKGLLYSFKWWSIREQVISYMYFSKQNFCWLPDNLVPPLGPFIFPCVFVLYGYIHIYICAYKKPMYARKIWICHMGPTAFNGLIGTICAQEGNLADTWGIGLQSTFNRRYSSIRPPSTLHPPIPPLGVYMWQHRTLFFRPIEGDIPPTAALEQKGGRERNLFFWYSMVLGSPQKPCDWPLSPFQQHLFSFLFCWQRFARARLCSTPRISMTSTLLYMHLYVYIEREGTRVLPLGRIYNIEEERYMDDKLD